MTSDWLKDTRHAIRALLRTPSFVLLAAGTLGLAIGANAGIFSVVDTVLLNPLPFANTDRLVYIAASAPGSDMPEEFPVATEFFLQYREQSQLLEEIATFNSFTNTAQVEDRIERVRMSAPSTAMFATLGVTPIMGRLPVPEDGNQVVVISHAMWTQWFGSDPEVLSRTCRVFGEDLAIIGVMGPEFFFPRDGTLLWVPRVTETEDIRIGRFGRPLVARMAPGASPEALATELNGLASRLPERYGGSAEYNRLIEQHQAVVRPLKEELLGSISGPLWILLGSVSILWIIACASVANLFMVRAERRLPDLAVRRALGAARGRLIFGQLLEAVVVAGLAGGLAVALAWLGVPLLLRAAPANLPRLAEVAVRPNMLLFTFAICAFSALLCGMVPALRFSAPSLTELREGGRGSVGRRWGRNGLVVAQTALALVLLIGSALLLRSFDKLRKVDPGYDTQDVFTFQIAPQSEALDSPAAYARFHLDFMDRVAALPGVERVGIVENVPLNEGVRSSRFRTEASPADDDSGTPLGVTWSAGDYFRAMGIEVFQGRTFTTADHTSQPGNVLVSRSAANLLWPGEDAIGKRLQVQELETWETVVGVVDDVMQHGFRQPAEPMVYFPLIGQDPENSRTVASPAYVVKTPRAGEIAPEIRALVREVAPTAPMYRMYTMEGLAADSMVQLSFATLTIGLASLLALILGVVGLYGVLSYAVAQRTREIGVRMALGAAARQVRLMIVGQGAKVLAVGIAVGSAAALLASRALGTLLYGVEPFDPVVYLAVATLMVLVGLAACYLPARRASKVDPMVSLRID